MAKKISSGTAHQLPEDLKRAIMADKVVLKKWNDITPLARNEWICWTISVKQDETRRDHVKRVVSELKEGMRRPCCWSGCIHRKDKPMNASQKWILSKRAKSK